MAKQAALVSADHIERAILLVRNHKVMLDTDLAALYRVPTKVLIQAVKRNSARFPEDFMFRLTAEEAARLRSQICDLKRRTRRQALSAIRIHRTWRRYALERPPESSRHPGQHCDHAGIRATPWVVDLEQGARPQAGRARGKIRRSFQSRL